MDIVERLRKVFGVVVKADDCFEEDYSVAREAADEIERLRQQNAKLVEVLGRMINEHKLLSARTLELARNVYQSNRG